MILKNNNHIYKKTIIFTLIFILIFNVGFIKNIYGAESNNKILILYDVYKEYGKDKNLLNYINNICLESGKEIDIISFSSYEKEDLKKYDSIFILNLSDNDLNENLKQNLKEYNKEIFWIGKETYTNFLDINKVVYTNNSEFKDSNYNKITKDLYENLGIQKEKNTYFYFSDVTPFSDLNILVEKIDYLKTLGIRFFIETIPVFKNENLKAMNRFAEVLRYAQVCGGNVVLKFPPLVDANVSSEDIEEKMKLGFKNYINYLVYPASISVSDYFLYREDLKNLLKSTDTIFIDSKVDIGVLNLNKYSLNSYKNVIKKIDIDDINNSYGNLAICVSNKLSLDEFKKKVSETIKKEEYFKNTYDMDSEIIMDNLKIESNKKGIFLNDKNVTQSHFINREEYSKLISKEDKNIKKETTINLTKTNNVLVIVSLIIAAIFISILFISFNIDRKKFLK